MCGSSCWPRAVMPHAHLVTLQPFQNMLRHATLLPAPAARRWRAELVLEAINRCDVDVRKDMYSSVVLAGGGALLPGLRERLERDLAEAGPVGAKVKVYAQANTLERRYAVWIGERSQGGGEEICGVDM